MVKTSHLLFYKMVYKCGYLIGSNENKMKLLNQMSKLYIKKSINVIQMKKLQLEILINENDSPKKLPSDNYLPIFINKEQRIEYYKNLNNKKENEEGTDEIDNISNGLDVNCKITQTIENVSQKNNNIDNTNISQNIENHKNNINESISHNLNNTKSQKNINSSQNKTLSKKIENLSLSETCSEFYNFNEKEYFENLDTKKIGQVIIFSEVLASSHNVLDGPLLMDGLVVIPRQQTQGTGRSNNIWTSPIGCAMYSMQLHIDLKSDLGKHLPFIQHVVAVSTVLAIKSINPKVNVGIKWPNDIYLNNTVKLGGIIVTSSILSTCYEQLAVCNLGVGLNLDNDHPTTCLNTILKQMQTEEGSEHCDSFISYEKYFALVFTHLEKLMLGDLCEVYDLYYKYWLHNNVSVTVVSETGEKQKVKIIGIDDFGFLNVRNQDGYIYSVRPDGNTFDMLNGLIAPKPDAK